MNLENLNFFEMPTDNVLYAIYGIFGILIFASILIFVLKKTKPHKNYSELVLRTKSWWYILGFILFFIFGGRITAILAVTVISYLALAEYFSLVSSEFMDRRVRLWAYLGMIGQSIFILIKWYNMFLLWIPVYAFLLLPFRMLLVGETQNYLKRISVIQWGLMLTAFSFGHLGYLYNLDPNKNINGRAAGLLLFVIALTQLNDVAQFCWGKAIGGKKIVPKISPNKTWAGFLGGVGTSAILSYLIAPHLTPVSPGHALFLGALISVGGFIGDVNMSALKRDIGVKDSGTVIPGHGGVLDRVDSLTYTAPIFFHFICYFYY